MLQSTSEILLLASRKVAAAIVWQRLQPKMLQAIIARRVLAVSGETCCKEYMTVLTQAWADFRQWAWKNHNDPYSVLAQARKRPESVPGPQSRTGFWQSSCRSGLCLVRRISALSEHPRKWLCCISSYSQHFNLQTSLELSVATLWWSLNRCQRSSRTVFLADSLASAPSPDNWALLIVL